MHYAWVVAFTGTLVTILAHGFGRMSYSVILPSMREGLSLNYTQVGLIGTGNFIGYLCLAILGGFMAARFGVRKVVFLSLLVIGVTLFLTGLSNSFGFAFLTRLFTGAGNGGAYVPIMALPAAWFVSRKRGLGTGIVSGGIGVGLFLSGVVLPGVIARFQTDGWRYAWFLLGIAVFLLSFVCVIFIRNTPGDKGLSIYGGGEEPRPSARVTLFSAWRDVLREREIWKLGSVYFMYGFSYVIYLTFFIAFLCKECGASASAAGWAFGLLGLCSIFSGILWGSISDSLGRRYGSMLAYLSLGLSYLVFALWRDQTGFVVSAVLFGLTAWSIPTIMAAASGDAVGSRLAPAGLGIITVFFGIGQALGPAVGGWIKDSTGTFTIAFLLSVFVSLAGAFGSLMLKKPRNASAGSFSVLDVGKQAS